MWEEKGGVTLFPPPEGEALKPLSVEALAAWEEEVGTHPPLPQPPDATPGIPPDAPPPP